MLARIAQELFWLGRDLARAEHTARMLDGVFHADVAGVPGERGIALSWAGVLAVIGAKPPVPGEEERESDAAELIAMPRELAPPTPPATSAWKAPSSIRAVCSARVRSRPSQNSSWAIRASISEQPSNRPG